MKKKLVIFVLVLCLAVSIVALAACNHNNNDDDGKVTCTLSGNWLPGVFCVSFADTDGGVYAELSENITEATRIPKGQIVVRVEMNPNVIVENMRVYINGRSMPLGNLNDEGIPFYQFTHEVTGNFELSFGGEASTYRLSVAILRNGEDFEGDVVNTAEDGDDHYEFIATVEGILEGGIYDCLSFESDNPDVADIDPHEQGSDFLAFWVVIGTAGTAHITFTTPTSSKTITVVVDPMAPAQVDAVYFYTPYLHLYNGWTNFAQGVDAHIICNDSQSVWRSWKVEVSDQSVIEVDSHMSSYDPVEHRARLSISITPKKAGTSVITLTAGDKTATCEIAVAEKPTEVTGSEGLEFWQDVNTGRWYITGWGSCEDENVVIPNVYNGERIYGVTMFNTTGLKSARSIVVSEGIVELSNAFRGCSNVTSITLPDSLTEIGLYSFRDCESLEEIDIPKGVTKIGAEAFENCTSLTEITLPENLENLSSGAFSGCSKLQTVEIPQSVKQIGREAFSGCSRLTEIRLPDGITEIPSKLFNWCNSLNSVNIPEGVTDIGEEAFSNCTSLVDPVIPQSVKHIAENAFSGCGFTELSFSDDVEYDNGAFYGVRVQKIIFKDMADLLAHWNVFVDNDYNNAEMSDGYKIYLGTDLLEGEITVSGETLPVAFLINYSGVTKVTFEGITVISQSAFSNCEDLEEIVLGDVQRIESNAFYDCGGLTIYLSAPVTLAENSFLHQAVTDYEIHFDDLKDWLGSEGLIAWNGAELYLQDALLDDVVTIPADVTKVPDCAFFGNNDITEFVLENGVEEIGAQAFSDCSVLTTITLPDSVTSIAPDALDFCRELTEIKCSAEVDVSGLTLYECDNFRGTLSEDERYYLFGGKIRSLVADLTYFVVPENLQFDDHAFDRVQNTLKYIFVHDLSVLDNVALNYCYQLKAIIYNTGRISWSSPDVDKIYEVSTLCTADGWIYEEETNVSKYAAIYGYIGDVDEEGNVTVPNKINNLPVRYLHDMASGNGHGTFFNDPAIEKITFSAGTIYVGSTCFTDLTELREVVLNAGCKWILMPTSTRNPVSETFDTCNNLESVTLPQNYKYTIEAIYSLTESEIIESSEYNILPMIKQAPNCYEYVVDVLNELVNGEEPPVVQPIETVVGHTFVFKEARLVGSYPVDMQDAIDSANSAMKGSTITFNEDGESGYMIGGPTGSERFDFTFTVDGNNVTLTANADGQVQTINLTIADDELIMDMPTGGVPGALSIVLVYVLQ